MACRMNTEFLNKLTERLRGLDFGDEDSEYAAEDAVALAAGCAHAMCRQPTAAGGGRSCRSCSRFAYDRRHAESVVQKAYAFSVLCDRRRKEVEVRAATGDAAGLAFLERIGSTANPKFELFDLATGVQVENPVISHVSGAEVGKAGRWTNPGGLERVAKEMNTYGRMRVRHPLPDGGRTTTKFMGEIFLYCTVEDNSANVLREGDGADGGARPAHAHHVSVSHSRLPVSSDTFDGRPEQAEHVRVFRHRAGEDGRGGVRGLPGRPVGHGVHAANPRSSP